MCEGTRASGRGETPRCSWTVVLVHVGASPWDVASLGALGISTQPCCVSSPSCSLSGLHRESEGAGSSINPCWVPPDPDPAGAAGERPQHAAGSPAAGELHPEGCPQPGHQPDGEQVRLGWGAEPGAVLWQTLRLAIHWVWPSHFLKVLLRKPQLAGGRGGSEEEFAK